MSARKQADTPLTSEVLVREAVLGAKAEFDSALQAKEREWNEWKRSLAVELEAKTPDASFSRRRASEDRQVQTDPRGLALSSDERAALELLSGGKGRAFQALGNRAREILASAKEDANTLTSSSSPSPFPVLSPASLRASKVQEEVRESRLKAEMAAYDASPQYRR